jgi:hypothetical protein
MIKFQTAAHIIRSTSNDTQTAAKTLDLEVFLQFRGGPLFLCFFHHFVLHSIVFSTAGIMREIADKEKARTNGPSVEPFADKN